METPAAPNGGSYHVDGFAALIWTDDVPAAGIQAYARHYLSPKDTPRPPPDNEPTIVVPDGLFSVDPTNGRGVLYCYERGVVVESVNHWQIRAVHHGLMLRSKSDLKSEWQWDRVVWVTSLAAPATEDEEAVMGSAIEAAIDATPNTPVTPWSHMLLLGSTAAVAEQLVGALRGLQGMVASWLASRKRPSAPFSPNDLLRRSARQATLEQAAFLQHEARRMLAQAGMLVTEVALASAAPSTRHPPVPLAIEECPDEDAPRPARNTPRPIERGELLLLEDTAASSSAAVVNETTPQRATPKEVATPGSMNRISRLLHVARGAITPPAHATPTVAQPTPLATSVPHAQATVPTPRSVRFDDSAMSTASSRTPRAPGCCRWCKRQFAVALVRDHEASCSQKRVRCRHCNESMPLGEAPEHKRRGCT